MMPRCATLLLATAATLLLSACPQPPPRPLPVEPPKPVEKPLETLPEEPPFTRQSASDVDRVLGYYGYLALLSPEQLQREQERTLRFYRQQYSDLTFLQLVMLRIMPQAPFRDSAQAQEMLSSFLNEPRTRASELRPVALLLHTMIAEQQQRDAELQAQLQKLKEETRRYEEVKQKLDALIDAERKMLERNKPARKP
jgi:hypothetical protein